MNARATTAAGRPDARAARTTTILDGIWSARLLWHRGGPEHPTPAPDVLARLAAGVDAAVPGHIHDVLGHENVIPDPFVDDNERSMGWVGRTNWRY